MVEAVHVRAGYGDNVILSDVTFDIERGSIVTLCGGSGCGKSTALRTLTGMLEPMAGEVRLFGESIVDADEGRKNELLRRTGMMFQHGALLGSLTLAENVALPLKEHTSLSDRVIRRVVEAKLALVGLGHALDRLPSEVSGGMLKRAGVARAIALDPELLFCDEPSAGLDPIVAAGLDHTLRQLQRELGMTIIVVTHELASIEIIADQVVMLDAGEVLAHGTVDELKHSDIEKVREFFARTAPHDERGETSLLDALEAP
ncbi:MAG: ATP-binding cassette domain-containing protein [Myxococcales bacterium]|nr:ATP-binding cassette domain-containing protein [Myxococcales bacterium]